MVFMSVNKIIRCVTLYVAVTVLALSCASMDEAERRLSPPRSTKSVRLDDIEKNIASDPARAIHLIGVYNAIYGVGGEDESVDDVENRERLAVFQKEASGKLVEMQAEAASARRWDEAASIARSLKALGVNVEKTGREAGILLEAAKEYLEQKNYLSAFLAAVHSNELAPLNAPDAGIFLEQAVLSKQRRTAAYFLRIIDKTGNGALVSQEQRGFAEGKDTARDMIKGVATVVVDRGIRVERGRGMADRVLGSAFFVDASGILVTNYHVIASEVDPAYKGYSRLSLRLGDSTSPRLPAKVIGWDKTMDLAVIKAEITPEYVFSVVDRVIPNVGDTVLAIGSPGGLEKTVTSGIVSALGRRFLQLGDVIQIDAAVNHGNSGGPVVDMQGRLVGIVFAGVEQFEGLNFAVPAERLAAALPAMLKGGKAARPWLGLSLTQTREGAEIIYIAPFTPASDQQVAEGSFITALNGEKLSAPQGELITVLQDRLFASEPGELALLETSDGKKHVLQLAERPATPFAEATKTDSKERIAAALFGLVLLPASGSLWTPQYLIKRVVRGSVADEAGLSAQDPIHIYGLKVQEKEGYALLDLDVKKRSSGYLETTMRLLALLDSPDTL
jgi:S1-C subfamily serine protease